MRRFFIAILIALAACPGVASAQQRRTTPATPRGGNTTTTPQNKTATPAAATTGQATKPTATGTQARPATSSPSTAAAVEDCACEAKPLPEVLASVNGVQITQKDLTEETRQRVRELQQQVVEARRNEVNLIINSKLLDAESKKRGMTSNKFLAQEIVAKTKEPTDPEAQAFFDQNKAQIQAGGAVEFKDVKSRIVDYLRGQRQSEAAKELADRLRAASQVKVLVPNVTPPATAADRARVLASVNGENITSADVEDNLRPLIYSVQEQVYELRKRDIDLRINDILLEQEAQKRKVTTKSLLDAEVASKVPAVTEADAQTFYTQNKERINGEFPQLKAQIIQYLQQREQQKAEMGFAQQLRNTSSVQTFITPPEKPVYNIATDDQPTKGNQTASVTVVEFTDYQCPSCAQMNPVIEKLATEYGDRVRFVIRDFPLTIHENAFKAAEAAEAAREQGKYWEYTNILFRNQSSLQVDKLKEYATQLGLDRQKFDAALDSGRFTEKVSRDVQDGMRFGVNATPTIFVNGRRVDERNYESVKAVIEGALKSASAAKK